MARSVSVPNVPKGYTGNIIWVCKGRGKQPYYLRVIARNRQIRLVSEGYPTRAHAQRAATSFSTRNTHAAEAWVIV